MPKFLPRIISFVLIPCLLTDLLFATPALNRSISPRMDLTEHVLFRAQAMASRVVGINGPIEPKARQVEEFRGAEEYLSASIREQPFFSRMRRPSLRQRPKEFQKGAVSLRPLREVVETLLMLATKKPRYSTTAEELHGYLPHWPLSSLRRALKRLSLEELGIVS